MNRSFAFFLTVIFCFNAFGQETYLLRGKVVEDEVGEGLPGATVRVKNTENGTITDIDGSFELQVKPKDTLVITYIGFQDKEIILNGQTELSVSLLQDIESLEEVIVTGYGTIRKSDLTGAVSSINVDNIADLPVPDITQALQGRVAGVQITQNSGAPGDGTSIRIRGVGSINNSSDPLYVVDGIIVNEINYLSQNDIQSLEVMKDASVAALYGSRASNGVIVITTKQGVKGAPKVSFGSQFGIQDFWNKLDVMDAREYLIMSEGLSGGGSITGFNTAINQLEDQNSEDNDWLDLVTQAGTRQQYDLAISGGNYSVTYRVSANYYTEEGILIESDFQRINLLTDLSFNVSKKLKFRANVLYSDRNRNVQDDGDLGNGNNGLLNRAVREAPTTTLINLDTGLPRNTPLTKAQDNFDQRDNSNIQVKFFLDYKLNQNIKFTSRFGFDQEYIFRKRYFPPGIATESRLDRDASGRIIENTTDRYKWNWDQLLSYDKEIDDHSISLTGAFSLERLSRSNTRSDGRIFLGRDENTSFGDNATGNFSIGGDGFNWSQIGAIFRSSYNYKGKYFAQFNLRSDGSSRFNPGNRWGVFPSASVAWYFSDDFFSTSSVVTGAKLRTSYGELGNNNIGNYETYTRLNNNQNGNRYFYVFGEDDDYNAYIGYSPQCNRQSFDNMGIYHNL